MDDREISERVQRMAADFEESYAESYERIDAGDDNERDDMEPYGVSVLRTIEMTLAGGGPSFRLYAELDRDGDVSKVYSIASWYGVPDVRTEHDEDSALYRYAVDQAEYVRDTGGEL